MTDTATLPLPTTLPELPPEPADVAPAPAPPADALPTAKPPRGRGRSRARSGDAAKPTTPARSRAKRAPAVNIAQGMTDLYVQTGAVIAAIPSGPAVAVTPDVAALLSDAGQDRPTVTQAIGVAIVTSGPAAGDALAKLAEDNPRIREALERMLTVSAFAGVLAAHLPIIAAAGLATGALPPFVAALLGGVAVTEGDRA